MKTILGYLVSALVVAGLLVIGTACDMKAPTPIPEDPVTVAPEDTPEQPEEADDPLDGLDREFPIDNLPPSGASSRR
jgi:predicted small lipoprotein YifL